MLIHKSHFISVCIKQKLYLSRVMINDNRIQNDHCLITTLARPVHINIKRSISESRPPVDRKPYSTIAQEAGNEIPINLFTLYTLQLIINVLI